MKRRFVESVSPEIESLLVSERELGPEANEFRARVVARARAALPRRPRAYLENDRSTSRPRRVSMVVAAAAGFMLVALCAAAFHAGYQARVRGSAPPLPTLTTEPRAAAPQPPAALPAKSREAIVAVTSSPVRSSKAKGTAPARTAADSEPYPIELRLLQPVQQAVLRRDFASALAGIAEHQRRFPSGQLVEEREALRVKSLFGLGHTTEAQRARAAFRERFPRSVSLRGIDGMPETSP
jgi:hypothetical protein